MLVSVARPRLSEEAVRQIRALIDSGEFKPGDKLPTERELSDMLGISRGSVREAIRTLEALGLVEVKPGRGIFVRAERSEDPPPELLLPTDVLASDLEDLIEVRSMVETRACIIAARRATAEDFEAMQSAIDEMRKAIADGDIARMVLNDLAFHHAVVVATKNKLLVRLEAAIAHQLMFGRRLALSTNTDPGSSADRHQQILDAIKAGDGEWAASLTLMGIKRFLERVLITKDNASANVEAGPKE